MRVAVEGTSLGSYEVQERLGAGGQGHVYRAVDTALDRELAIKVLPAAFVADPLRLKQFQQEAKLLAAASHPNIAAVYAIEEYDGVHFFTQELVPGRTLKSMIDEGPLDVEDTADIGRQIAAALEMAHERKLVHRDLKPSNVMVMPDGNVKVLDFGLALPVDRDESADDYAISDSTPTISRSAESVIIGTAPYMSPDQARGRMVDRRTDIWSFGCVLFECLTGDRPFRGETLLDTLSAIVRSEPDWDKLPVNTPERMRILIQRCLRKRVADRLQHIGDARIVLEEVVADPLIDANYAGGQRPAPVVTRPAWSMLAAAALAGAALGAAAWSMLGPAPAPVPALRTAIVTSPVALDLGYSTAIDISRDGTEVAYVASGADAERQIYRSELNSFVPIAVDGTAGASNPFYSPDGERIGFFSSDFELAYVSRTGGLVRTITSVPVADMGAAWLDDDTIVYGTYSTDEGMRRVSVADGESQLITELNRERGETNHGWPHALPDGRSVVFTVTTADAGFSAALLDLDTLIVTPLIPEAAQTRYSTSGHLVFVQDGELFSVGFDPATREVLPGTPRRLISGLMTHTGRAASSSFALSHDGKLVYVPGVKQGGDTFVWVDQDGTAEPIDSEITGEFGHPRLAPDGRRFVYDSQESGRGHIWVYDMARGFPTRLTDAGDNQMPVWELNQDRVVFARSGAGGEPGIYWHSADGGGDSFAYYLAENSLWPRSFSPDRSLAYYELNPETGRNVWILAGTGEGAEPELVKGTPFNERAPMFSPDGQWIAYVSNETGRDEVYVSSTDSNVRTEHRISNDGGKEPMWAPDGRALFYRSAQWMMRVALDSDEAELIPSAPAVLFADDFKREPTAGNQYYDVASDGRFLMIREPLDLRPDRIHLVSGFAAELQAGDREN
jgi:Tol biopolymer transport system component